jgi:hypothetical protein
MKPVDGTGYSFDETDRSRVATDGNVSAAAPIANFNQFVTLGDVVELELVNSPVEVTAGGISAEVVNKVGWPGTKDLYRVDLRHPTDVSGDISIQVSAAWITGPEFRIPVR